MKKNTNKLTRRRSLSNQVKSIHNQSPKKRNQLILMPYISQHGIRAKVLKSKEGHLIKETLKDQVLRHQSKSKVIKVKYQDLHRRIKP